MMRPSVVVAEDHEAADECDCQGNEAALVALEISTREVRDQQRERNELAHNSADEGQQDREDSVENDDSDFE